jgi:hypothetical protein
MDVLNFKDVKIFITFSLINAGSTDDDLRYFVQAPKIKKGNGDILFAKFKFGEQRGSLPMNILSSKTTKEFSFDWHIHENFRPIFI